jgi:type II secretory pathway pseudopilin PulG
MTAKGNSSHNRRAAPGRRSAEQGYVLVVFILFAALLLVGLSTIIPKAVFEGRREKEEELIFRGMQYQRAIQLFYRKFGRYPNSVDELVKTNQLRFLRKRFKDPITKDGEWRFIHVGPGGVFLDALTIRPPAPSSAPGSGTNPSQPGGTGTGLATPPGMATPGGLAQPGAGQSFGQPPPAGSAFGGGLSGGGTLGGGLSGAGTQPAVPALAPSADPGTNVQLQSRSSDPNQQAAGSPAAGSETTSTSSSSSQPSSGSPLIATGPIAGVASKSKADSIKIWNAYTAYDHWEFIYNFQQDQLAAGVLARPGAAPGQPLTQPTAPGQQQPASPFGMPFGQPGGAPNQPGGFPNQPGMMPAQPSPAPPQFPPMPPQGGFPSPGR